jgi:hypothetical protein
MPPPGPTSTSVPELEAIQSQLFRQECRIAGKILLLILAAVPGLLIDAAILSGIVWLLGPYQHHVPWWPIFFICIPIAIPLFCWIDKRTQSDTDLSPIDPSITSPSGHMMMWGNGYSIGNRGGVKGSPITTAMLLFGPRLLRKAFQMLRARRMFSHIERARAAVILRELVLHGQSSEVHLFLKPNEQPMALFSVLGYLEFYQWIDASHDTQRIWLTIKAKSSLGLSRE